MIKPIAYMLMVGFTLSAGLWLADSATTVVDRINARTVANCDSLNAVTPGSCVMR